MDKKDKALLKKLIKESWSLASAIIAFKPRAFDVQNMALEAPVLAHRIGLLPETIQWIFVKHHAYVHPTILFHIADYVGMSRDLILALQLHYLSIEYKAYNSGVGEFNDIENMNDKHLPVNISVITTEELLAFIDKYIEGDENDDLGSD